MTNSPYARSALAQAALELAPPLIRETLLKESDFREKYGFRVDAVLAFGDSGVSIQRHELFEAIRKIHSGARQMEVAGTDGRKWALRNDTKIGEQPTLAISNGRQGLVLPDFTALSPNRNKRLHALDEAASDVNLPAGARNSWHNVLSIRALEDEEVDELDSDFRDTPVHCGRSIRSEIENGKSRISSFVPRSRRYFERLVGAYDGSASIGEYAAGRGRQFVQQLSAWRPYDGFLYSLLLSSHSALTDEIGVEDLGSEDLVRAFEFLEKHGDRISQLGAIEVGLRVFPKRPEIEPSLIRLIQQIRDDDVDAKTSSFKLLSALFVLLDGELSRLRLLSLDPPFYRRLASLSQAALIHRHIANSGVETDPFCDWVFSNHRGHYSLQSLVDMRLEPRWNPDLGAASQMKAEFFGRIMIKARQVQKNIKGGELHDLVLGTGPGSLHSLSQFPRPYFPGPLEGAEACPNTLPADVSEAIRIQLESDEVAPSSFIALVNSASIFSINSDQAALAAKALKRGSYRLANVENKLQLLTIFDGLATVAAVTRSSALADELRVLVRRYRLDTQNAPSIEETIRICLIAAASRASLNDWRDYSGDWLTELALGDLEGDDGEVLQSCVQNLCHVVPELWISCARADAALRAFNGR